jgi:hypothetical protein
MFDDLEMTLQGHGRFKVTADLDSSWVVSYEWLVVTKRISGTVWEILTIKNLMTLK